MKRFMGVMTAVTLAVLGWADSARAQGIIFPGAGATHLGMAGASTAAPVDALGALYWNPAAVSGLPRNEFAVGGEGIYSNIHLASSLPDALGGQSGETRSDSGFGLASAVGLVYHLPDSGLTAGLGLMTLAGGAVNFPGDPNNPILASTGPGGRVFLGPLYSSTTAVAITPTVSYQVTDNVAFGFGPVVDVAVPSFDPAYFGTPSRLDPNAPLQYPSATHNRPFWGGGFRAGLYTHVLPTLDVGFGYTSPQWFERWTFNTHDARGNPQEVSLKVSLPAIYSLGLGWRPTDRLLLASDLRYLDYANAEMFGDSIPTPGLAWRSVWALALGSQYRLTDAVALRLGYLWNQNPVPDVGTIFQAQAPGIGMHTITCGASADLNEWITLSLGYAHVFENSTSGSSVLEQAGLRTRLSASTDLLLFGLHVKFGPPPSRTAVASAAPAADPMPAELSSLGSPSVASRPGQPWVGPMP